MADPPLDADLLAAYRHTTYEADLPLGRVRLRVGDRHPDLEAWLAQHGWTTWGFVTGWNPGSIEATAEDNRQRHLALTRAVAALRLPSWPGRGVPDAGDWTPEESLFIAGITRQDAVALGVRFGQRAIVWGDADGDATLVACVAGRVP